MSVKNVEADLRAAVTDNDFCALGTRCRETVKSLAQLVFSSEKHLPDGTPAPSPTDSEEMLSLFFNTTLDGSTATEARAFVRGLITLNNAIVHRNPPRPLDAKLAVFGLRSLVELVAILTGMNFETEPWKVVQVGQRFFAWDGGLLYSLDDRKPIIAPPEAIQAINDAGHHTSYCSKERIQTKLAQGARQVYEPDKREWRRELTHGIENHVLIVREGD